MENKIVNKNEGCKISASEKKKYKQNDRKWNDECTRKCVRSFHEYIVIDINNNIIIIIIFFRGLHS